MARAPGTRTADRVRIGQKTVPDEAVDLRKHDPGFGAVSVEQAQLDPLGHLADDEKSVPDPS